MNDDLALYNRLTSAASNPQTQLYNALGRNAGTGGNFFTKRASSIGNAVGTTLSAPISLAHDIGENMATQKFLGDSKSRMNEVAKKYGYNSYHDVWDARDKAEAEGDQATLDFINNTINPELQAQANANAEEATAKAKGYEDYRKNNLVSKNINQDRGKFLGSAINTLSTAVDVTGLGANPLANAIQGGVEGIADELEQSGFKDFNLERAGQNALIGATTGAVTGALNQGVSNVLAKRGGNLFKGGNALTRGLNNLGSNTALGRVGSTIATGAGRGALSGAVGGATGAGISAAMNGQDVLSSALQGAAQGAQQGAFTGATMAGANMALNRTPLMRQINQAQEDWRKSGSNFDERLTNTLTSGNSAVGEWLQGNRRSGLINTIGTIGNRIADVGTGPNNRVFSVSGADEQYTFASTDAAPRGIKQAAVDYAYETDGRIDPSELTEFYNAAQKFEGDIHSLAEQYSMETGGRVDPNEYVDFMMQSSKTGNNLGTKSNYSSQEIMDAGVKALGLGNKYTGSSKQSQVQRIMEAGFDALNLESPYDSRISSTPTTATKDVKLAEEAYNEGLSVLKKMSVAELRDELMNFDYTEADLRGLSKNDLIQMLDETLPYGAEAYAGGNNSTGRVDAEEYVRSLTPESLREFMINEEGYDPARVPKSKTAMLNRLEKDFVLQDLMDVSYKPKSKYQQEYLVKGQDGYATDTPTTAKGWLKRAGERIIEDANDRGVGLSIRDASNRLAFAGNEGGQVNGLGGETNGLFSSSVIKGGAPDGGNLVKADYPLPKNASKRAIGQTIRDVIKSRFQGNSYDVGDTGIKAAVNSRTVSEMGYQQPNMNDSDFNRKGSMAGNLDELLENMTDARRIENKKPDTKPNVDYYISGRVAVDVGDGEIYNPRVDVEVKNGRPVAYNISDIKKYPGATPQGVPSGGDQPAVDYRGTYGRETIVPQNEQNVNPETEVYRTLTGESEPLRTSKEYEYRQKRNQKLLDQYGTIDKPTAKAVRAVETVGKIADAGFEKPADVEAAIKKITGSDGAVNKLNRKVIANAGQINTMDGVDNGTSLTDFIDQQIRMNGLYGTNDGKALATEIEAILNQLPSRRDGTITGLDSAEDAFDVIQMLEKHAANYKGRSGSNYATSNPYKEQKAAVIESVATMLKDRIYDASDVSQVVTPDVIADMKSWYPKNEKWAKWVDQNIATAKTGADLRAAQAPFVRMGKLIDNTIINSGTFGSKVPRQLLRIATSNPLGVLINGAEMAAETPIGNRASAWVYDKLADRAARREASNPTPTPAPTPATGEPAPTLTPTSAPTPTPTPAPVPTTNTATITANPATQIYNAIGRNEGLQNGEQARTANYLADAVNQTNGETAVNNGTLESLVNPGAQTATAQNSVYNSLYGTNGTMTTANTAGQYFQPTGDYWTDLLGRAMSSAIEANDVEAFASLYGMYQDALSKQQSASESSSSQKLTATQQRANAAMNSLNRISQMTPDLGYNLSNIPIIGGIATFGGNDYESEAKSLAQQIGYMVSGANIKESEAENIGRAYVPQPWDSERTRTNKLQRAYEIIQQYQNGYAE